MASQCDHPCSVKLRATLRTLPEGSISGNNVLEIRQTVPCSLGCKALRYQLARGGHKLASDLPEQNAAGTGLNQVKRQLLAFRISLVAVKAQNVGLSSAIMELVTRGEDGPGKRNSSPLCLAADAPTRLCGRSGDPRRAALRLTEPFAPHAGRDR